MVEYKDRLLEAMNDAGMTTSMLAGKLELTYQAVDKVLKGNTKELTASNNSRAALILNVSTDWLATGKGSKSRNQPDPVLGPAKLAGYLSPAEVTDLVSLYATCSDKGRALVMDELRSAAVRYRVDDTADNKREAG